MSDSVNKMNGQTIKLGKRDEMRKTKINKKSKYKQTLSLTKLK
jgi:hypothetical protein